MSCVLKILIVAVAITVAAPATHPRTRLSDVVEWTRERAYLIAEEHPLTWRERLYKELLEIHGISRNGSTSIRTTGR